MNLWETQRLYGRTVEDTPVDAESWYAMLRDWPGDPCRSVTAARRAVRRSAAGTSDIEMPPSTASIYTIHCLYFLRSDDAPVGLTRWRIEGRHSFSVGGSVHPDHRGHGYWLEAQAAIMQFGFRHLGIEDAEFETLSTPGSSSVRNMAAILRASGARQVYTRTNSTGRVNRYRITAAAWWDYYNSRPDDLAAHFRCLVPDLPARLPRGATPPSDT